MNLEFNIAVHVLSFLVKHDNQQFSSQSLAKLTCLNPVQLRRVTTVLNQYQFINTSRGKMVAIVQIIQLLALNYQYYIVYLCLKKIANSVFSQVMSRAIVKYQET